MLGERFRTPHPDRKTAVLAAPLRRRSWFLPAPAPALLALGLSSCGDAASSWSETSPIIVKAEDGTLGADVRRVTDATDSSITYVTANANVTQAPADLNDPRVASQRIEFPKAGQYEIYVRLRVGPEGGNDDSFFLNIPNMGMPSWQNINGVRGFDVEGGPLYQAGAIVATFGGNTAPGVWRWALLDSRRLTVPAGELTQTFSFATREDGLDIDEFAFSLVGDGYTIGFTTAQLDAGQAGVMVPTPPLPDPYEPPATQAPLAVGSTKYLGMVCCGGQRPFLENYFNQIVPENAGKWGSVESVRDEYNWTAADEALALAEANGFPFRFHVLLWGSQQPDWIETLPPEEQLMEIREWFEAVNERYGARLTFLEVANEFDNQPPTAQYEGKYTEALGGAGESGLDWVLNGFRMAREIFPPSVKLMLNEYSVINNDERTARYIALVERLKQENLIDAIGEQGHAFSTTGDVQPMLDRINQLGATGLPLYITEMDIDGPPAQQLIDYQRIFAPIWENQYVQGITLWGYREGMWRTQQQATLVYPNGAEKPALRWLKGYLRGGAPVVAGPTRSTMARSAKKGAAIATFSATGPDGAAYPAGANVSWGVVPGPGQADGAAVQALTFAEGTGRLELSSPLSPGTYRARVYADVDATVSNLYEVEIAVE
jgi:endo-1,4-beta-xylanase